MINVKSNEKNYVLEGMSCEGCVNNVKLALQRHPDITEVEVQLHPLCALLTMTKFIDTNELQVLLTDAGNYTIKDN